MEKHIMMEIATKVYPDSITWDLLEKVTQDPELLNNIILDASKKPMFSEEQEKEVRDWVHGAINAGILNFNRAYLKLVNWTDIIYALIKAYEPQFKPECHV